MRSTDLTTFTFNPTGDALGFLACSRPLEIQLTKPLKNGDAFYFEFSFQGVLTFDDFPIGSITEAFTELGLYAPIFPVTENMSNAFFDLNINADSHMTFLHADLTEPLFDFSLLGSKYYKNQYIKQNRITVYYTLSSDETKANHFLIMCEYILSYYEHLFGNFNQNEVAIVITPRVEGGGYCRNGLIVLSTDVSDTLFAEDIFGYLAHELAHLWWLKAPVNTYEDWLNESFAEFSRMLACKKRFGDMWYEKRIAKYKETYHTTPPIIGIDRNDPKAFEVLYKKGTAILAETFQGLSENEFKNLFHMIHSQKITSTDALLGFLEGMQGAEFVAELGLKLERL